jgi:hypothetical protein
MKATRNARTILVGKPEQTKTLLTRCRYRWHDIKVCLEKLK